MQFTGKIKIVISRNAVEGIGHLDHLFMAASRFKSTPATAVSPPNCLGTNAALGCGFSEIRSLAACSTGVLGMVTVFSNRPRNTDISFVVGSGESTRRATNA